MNKNILNNFLNLSINRRKRISSRNFFLRLITNPDMFSQSILSIILSKFNLCIPCKTYTFWGKRMKIFIPEVVSSEIRRYGYIEDSVASFIINYCHKGELVIDIGSHFGFFALLMSEVVEDKGSVHCFEPTPSTFSVLKKNTALNKNIVINKNAVFDKNVEVELNDYGLASSAFNSIKETRQKKYYARSIGSKIKVKAIKLDDYVISKKLKPTLIKIDAESSEHLVLKGMDYILSELKPILCIEFGDLGVKGVLQSREIINYLIENYGYKTYVMNAGKLKKHKLQDKYSYINLFFKK